MLKPTVLKVSVIIPCYNEQESLPRCLEALAAQTVKPYEIIVVDNNSSDKTTQVARSYGAKVLKERTQGVIAARNAGMNRAKGDILARIDADTAVAVDWIEELLNSFSNTETAAVTGTGDFYDLPLNNISRSVRNFFAVYANRLLLGHNMLWGSNMAIRRGAWAAIVPNLCDEANIMEDLDIAMHLHHMFGKEAIMYNPNLRADISGRRATSGTISNFLYLKMWPKTLRNHRGYHSYLAWVPIGILLAGAPYLAQLGKIYDGQEKKWILNPAKWRKNTFDRGNP